MTSKHQNGSVKFIIHAKKCKQIVNLHKSLMFNFEKASFFQKLFLIDYFIKMLKIMHILGLCVDVSGAACR